MWLLDLVGRRRYDDPALGTLVGRWGRWHGQIAIGSGPTVPLAIAGGWRAPDQARLRLARDLVTRYEALRPTIAMGLFEHYAPYTEAFAEGEAPLPPGLSHAADPDQIWPLVSVVRVLIAPLAGTDTVEIAYRAAWDEEHTLGARFQEWRLVEVNGSVLV
jgi:hypothetical protein